MPVMQHTYFDVIFVLQYIKRNYDEGLAPFEWNANVILQPQNMIPCRLHMIRLIVVLHFCNFCLFVFIM